MRAFLGLVILCAAYGHALGKNIPTPDFDFTLVFSKCSVSLVPVSAANFADGKEIRTVDGENYQVFCNRNSRKIICALSFDKGEKGTKGNVIKYDVLADVAGEILLSSNGGADFVRINATQGTAASITRILFGEGTASKICRGVHLTRDEFVAFMNEGRSTQAK
jgi:hypothetical protein